MKDLLIGWTTTETLQDAEKLAMQLVESKLVACVQIDGPITSVYNWKGKVEKNQEFRIMLKFLCSNAENVENWIKENHPYENPELVIVIAVHTSPEYMDWVRESSQSPM